MDTMVEAMRAIRESVGLETGRVGYRKCKYNGVNTAGLLEVML